MTQFSSLLIANRGEIAVRVARTARRMGITTVAVYSDVDGHNPHVLACDTAVAIGGATPAESYLLIDKLIDAAKHSGAQAIHPGYGFLSENAEFARRVVDAGLIFVGPPASAIDAMGDKARARQRMAAADIPVVPGYDGDEQSEARLLAEAARIGFPIMIKASAGGGGRGMRRVDTPQALAESLRLAVSEAQKAFGDGRMILERAVIEPRHVEIQVFADLHGNVVHLGERDCSIQRRHQKIVEEAPSPAVSEVLRRQMGEAAVAVAREIGYAGAGTVEFLLDQDGGFYFMEMNTRLQVEHPVTELVTGQDLVEWQLRVARGESLPLKQEDICFSGHAIEVRLCAEEPADDFLPRTGNVLLWRPGHHVRCDHALADGMNISPFYDSMLGKVIAHGATRTEAIERLARGLDDTTLLGVASNRAFLTRVLRHPAFVAGSSVSTAFIAQHFAGNASRARIPDRDVWDLAAWLSVATVDGIYAIPASWRNWSNGAPLPVPWRLAWLGAHPDGTRAEQRGTVRAGAGQAEVLCEGSASQISGRAGQSGEMGAAQLGDRAVRYQYAWEGSHLWLQLDGEDYHFVCQNRVGSGAKDNEKSDGVLRSPMNGRVILVEIEEGAMVEAGQTLMVLEAMKMEHQIFAPFSGTVTSLGAQAGDQIMPGHILAQLAPT